MFQNFLTHVKEKVVFTSGKQELIKTYFIPKKLRKKQYMLQEGDVCKYFVSVESSLLRSCNLDGKS